MTYPEILKLMSIGLVELEELEKVVHAFQSYKLDKILLIFAKLKNRLVLI